MEIIVDKFAGFCFGVKRAVDLTLDEASLGNTVTYGELIHNPNFIQKLSSEGISSIDDTAAAEGKTVVIRAHGIPVQIEDKLRRISKKLVDGTCPFVKKVHNLVKEYDEKGYHVLILGEINHPEMVGAVSYGKNVKVVKEASDIPTFKSDEKIIFLSQTTQKLRDFNKIKDYLNEKYQTVVIKNTICNATETKQASAAELAKVVDLMVVVGGKNSCNTTGLKDICSQFTRTIHIESGDELKRSDLEDCEKIGITAGASTPDYLIKEVVDIVTALAEPKKEMVKC